MDLIFRLGLALILGFSFVRMYELAIQALQ